MWLITQTQVLEQVEALAERLLHTGFNPRTEKLYGVPRGGTPVALALAARLGHECLADVPEDAAVIVDDIYDSGRTRARYPDQQFEVLFDKREPEWQGWLTMPWEYAHTDFSGFDIVQRLIQFLGEDQNRPGLLETPARVSEAWSTWFGGYGMDPGEVLKCFEDGAEDVDEMIVQRGIPVWSHCEHHMAPFFGVAHIGYVPKGRIVGLSKLSRIVDIYARRLQVQERLTTQIADALMEHLQPLGVGVVLQCRHTCMESRGIQQAGIETTTSAMRGCFREDAEVPGEALATRAEFMALIK